MNSMVSPATAAAANLELEYLPSHQIAAQPAAWWQGVLGVVGFDRPPRIAGALAPVTASMTRALSGEELCEVWRVASSGSRLRNGDASRSRVQFRYSDELLFGALNIDEQSIDTRDAAGALLRATEIAYQEIFDVLEDSDHRHLVRIWNYLPDINRSAGGDERYRHFNSARQAAFRKSGRATMGTVPAACALGSPSGSPISIYFLAARRPPKMIENPRQTSAYHYPPKFGRHRPIFSRACVWGESGAQKLFVSGTASIVGHETLHRGDVVAQTQETMVNIGTLLDEANRLVGAPRYAPEDLKLKVYVRNPQDLPAIEATLAQMQRPTAPVVYLQADVCREDLLMEIEAVG